MEISTLRNMTAEICGRTMNEAVEEHLPRYAVELAGLLATVRDVSRQFPEDLAPASVFALAPRPKQEK